MGALWVRALWVFPLQLVKHFDDGGIHEQAPPPHPAQHVPVANWAKVDFATNTLTVEGVVKNRYRTRRIPVSKVVAWVLRWSKQWNSAVGPNDPVQPGYGHYRSYSQGVARAIKHWKPGLAFKPKDLRNTLQTAAIDGDWYGYHVVRYVGHSPRNIGERHYYGDRGARLVEQLKTHVVEKIEAEIAGWEAPQDALILPGPRLVSAAAGE